MTCAATVWPRHRGIATGASNPNVVPPLPRRPATLALTHVSSFLAPCSCHPGPPSASEMAAKRVVRSGAGGLRGRASSAPVSLRPPARRCRCADAGATLGRPLRHAPGYPHGIPRAAPCCPPSGHTAGRLWLGQCVPWQYATRARYHEPIFPLSSPYLGCRGLSNRQDRVACVIIDTLRGAGKASAQPRLVTLARARWRSGRPRCASSLPACRRSSAGGR